MSTYEILNLKDKPMPNAGPFWAAMRNLKEGECLFLHRPEGKTLGQIQSRAGSVNAEHPRPGYRIRTQQDNQRDGVWVWWEKR